MSEAYPGLPTPPPPPEPRVATAVVLWREAPRGREVFWVRRGDRVSFAGGFHAFPGGRLDPSDADVPVPGLAGEEAALVACAARELFEETGVLLARGAAGLSRADRDAARRALLDERISFARLLADRGLALDPSRLEAAGRWVTPPFLPLRYDARLFLVRLGEGEEAAVWPGELAGGEFVAASRALELWERGEVLLHPPNLCAVSSLARAAPPECLELKRAPPQCRDFVSSRIEFQRGVWLAALRSPTLPPATHTNCWLLDVGGALAVVDPGSPYPEEQAELESLLDLLAGEGLAAREIWLTHHHADHVGGVGRLAAARGLPVLAHPETAARLPDVGPVTPLAGGTLLHGRFRALHTPGHARGHLAFHDERTGALFCGDMVSTLSTIVIDPPEGDMAEYLRSLERLGALAPRTLYPAHGPPAPDGAGKLAAYLAHRSEREAKIVAALAGGGTLAEVTRAAYDDTPPFLLPVAERSCLATLEKLRAEGRARDVAGRWQLAASR